jgi:hypothetical protein
VIFNGKGKTAILARDSFNEIKYNWSRLLSAANVKKCVDAHLIEEDFPPNDANFAAKACNHCLESISEFKVASKGANK